MWFLTVLQKMKRRQRAFARSLIISLAGTDAINGGYRPNSHYLGWPAWIKRDGSGIRLEAVTEDGDQYQIVNNDRTIAYYTSQGIAPSTGVITDYLFSSAGSGSDIGEDPQPVVTYVGDALPPAVAEFTASGAGTAAVNDHYLRSGALNDRSAFQSDGTTVYCRYIGGAWIFSNLDADEIYYTSGPSTELSPELVTWTVGPDGVAPVPVITI